MFTLLTGIPTTTLVLEGPFYMDITNESSSGHIIVVYLQLQFSGFVQINQNKDIIYTFNRRLAVPRTLKSYIFLNTYKEKNHYQVGLALIVFYKIVTCICRLELKVLVLC